uniref:Uncharacterized protein n=1 Tax=Zonotrichia albicollis TaxID=44394 RepID=A0A8D2MGL7_ZONAL
IDALLPRLLPTSAPAPTITFKMTSSLEMLFHSSVTPSSFRCTNISDSRRLELLWNKGRPGSSAAGQGFVQPSPKH